MAKQLDLDLKQGLQLKDTGMSLAAMDKTELLETARDIAEDIALKRGEVTIDDVRFRMNIPKTQTNKANWIGSVFRDDRFVWTHKVRPSAIPSNHGRMIKIWTLKDFYIDEGITSEDETGTLTLKRKDSP